MHILFNGCLTSEFKLENGLRQGEPLTPFLFTIMVKGLSDLMRKAVENNLFKGVIVGDKKVDVNLL